MNPLDEQIEALTQILRAHGAVVGYDPNAPDYVKRAWLDILLNCPDCKAEIGWGKGDGHGQTN